LPTNTPIPPGFGIGLRGEYYDNIDLTNLKLIRIDNTIDFDWGQSSPNSNISSNSFSVIWTGEVQPLYSENYTFYTETDDGVRLWVDNIPLIDNWTNYTEAESSGSIMLEAGVKYKIRLEYYENTEDALAKLMWCSESQEKEVIPQTQLYPTIAFTALEHKVKLAGSADNIFAVGDYIPLMLKIKFQIPMDNPVISVNLNIFKQNGTMSGFILKEILSGTSINKNLFKIRRNESSMEQSSFFVWAEGSESERALKIKVVESFQQNDTLEINYVVKASAVDSVFDTGIKEYFNVNSLNGVDMYIFYEIVERVESGLVLTDVYSKDSTSDLNEKLKFQADIKLEDPIQLE
jgi:hypothetical protein